MNRHNLEVCYKKTSNKKQQVLRHSKYDMIVIVKIGLDQNKTVVQMATGITAIKLT